MRKGNKESWYGNSIIKSEKRPKPATFKHKQVWFPVFDLRSFGAASEFLLTVQFPRRDRACKDKTVQNHTSSLAHIEYAC